MGGGGSMDVWGFGLKNKIKQGPEQTATTVGKIETGMANGYGYGGCAQTNIESGIKKTLPALILLQ